MVLTSRVTERCQRKGRSVQTPPALCRARGAIRESQSSNVLTAVKRISRAVCPKQAREPLSSSTYLLAANLKVGTMFDDSTSQECAPESKLLGQATRAFPDRLNRRPSMRRS